MARIRGEWSKRPKIWDSQLILIFEGFENCPINWSHLDRPYLKSSTFSNEGHWANGHNGDDDDQGEPTGIGESTDEAEDAGADGEEPLANVPGLASGFTDLTVRHVVVRHRVDRTRFDGTIWN